MQDKQNQNDKRQKPKDLRENDPRHIDVIRDSEGLESEDGNLDTPDTNKRPDGQTSRN